MPVAFYIFAALLVLLSYRSFRGGVDYLNYFKQELAKPPSHYAPFATIIAPCKGLDEELAENLSALVAQDYPLFEVIFVVDDENDPAVSVIENLLPCDLSPSASGPVYPGHSVKLVVAGKSTESGQKVENLRAAVLQADEHSEVFVFVDSDVRPANGWLRDLVAPLADETVGAATGYRWFISEHSSFASELRSAWNASIASALGPNTANNFCWGGSTAIRREIFERVEMRKRWRGTLSDDFAVTRVLNESGLPIKFVPQALTPSFENCTFRECLEFTTRQIKITRVYMPQLWLMSLVGSGLFTAVMIAAIFIPIFSIQNSVLVWAAITTLFLVSLFSIGKAWLRIKAVRMVIPAASMQMFTQLTLWLLAPPLFLYNAICALVSRRMTWRGITYELVSADKTKRLP